MEIAENIKQTVKDKPLTIVLTHQHKDHVTGFYFSGKSHEGPEHIRNLVFYLDDPKGKEAKVMRDATRKILEEK
jgi:glyoxylase-like metal-dependent hydrolase (beta-lactamase superfamily II)